ncbi:MAG: hypothetical protein K6F94_04810 [Bacteroidaceae bacterium]|nr:hypothetical protein [Bacteroidaceae bacterium]
MTKTKTLLVGLIVLLTASLQAQERFDFSAVAYNVDGLPNSILSISINPDGPGADGTKAISQKLAAHDWDLIGVSEDFNFHSELMSSLTDYSAGTHRGGMGLGNMFDIVARNAIDTDGLNLLWHNKCSVSGEYMERWQKSYGYDSNGNDEMVKKGFRRYEVAFSQEAVVEVYVLHMDAEIDAEDNAAREVQWSQLCNAILQRGSQRPVIVIGDTNSRYTRDKVKSLFIDPINQISNLTVQDAWVQLKRGGEYPLLGSNALMESELGDKGEVVDKILYINNTQSRCKLKANSYSLDRSIVDAEGNQLADHYPVVVDFTLTVSKPSTYQLQAGQYYMQNAATGQWLDAGGAWGTHALTSGVGHPVYLEPLSEATSNVKYNVNTHIGNGEGLSYLSQGDSYMDSEAAAWRISVKDKSRRAYTVLYTSDGANYALAANADGEVVCEAYDAENEHQLWIFRTGEERNEMFQYANAANPVDATYLLPGAGFGRNDSEANALWQGSPTIGWADYVWDACNFNAEKFNGQIGTLSSTKTNFDVYQNITVPNGLYYVSLQAFYRDGSISHADSGRLGGSEMIHSEFYLNDKSVYVPSIFEASQQEPLFTTDASSSFGYIPNDQPGAAVYFSRGLYTIGQYVKVTDGNLRIGIRKDHTKTESWTCFDNFRLTYFGDAEEEDVANGISATHANGPTATEYFTPDGLRVSRPGRGLHIVRQPLPGGVVTVRKVLIR